MPRPSVLVVSLAILLAVAVALAPGLRPANAQDPKVEAAKKDGKVVWYISMFDVDTAAARE